MQHEWALGAWLGSVVVSMVHLFKISEKQKGTLFKQKRNISFLALIKSVL